MSCIVTPSNPHHPYYRNPLAIIAYWHSYYQHNVYTGLGHDQFQVYEHADWPRWYSVGALCTQVSHLHQNNYSEDY